MFYELRCEAVVPFVVIGEIVDHHCLSFLFISVHFVQFYSIRYEGPLNLVLLTISFRDTEINLRCNKETIYLESDHKSAFTCIIVFLFL